MSWAREQVTVISCPCPLIPAQAGIQQERVGNAESVLGPRFRGDERISMSG
jgi:hypothetical protein